MGIEGGLKGELSRPDGMRQKEEEEMPLGDTVMTQTSCILVPHKPRFFSVHCSRICVSVLWGDNLIGPAVRIFIVLGYEW